MKEGRQHAFGGPMAALRRVGQAAVGGGRPTAGRGPIRAEVRADPQGRRGDYGRAYQREMYIYRSMTYFM